MKTVAQIECIIIYLLKKSSRNEAQEPIKPIDRNSLLDVNINVPGYLTHYHFCTRSL